MATLSNDKLWEVASRIREMREIADFTQAEMAEKTEVTEEEYTTQCTNPEPEKEYVYSLRSS